jgi:Arc/MetJ-type ribon-helix-helix transcriptional regulator
MPRSRIQAIIAEETHEKIKDDLVDGHRSESEVVRQAVAEMYEEETGEELTIIAGRKRSGKA